METGGRCVYSTEPGEGRTVIALFPFEGVVDSVNSLKQIYQLQQLTYTGERRTHRSRQTTPCFSSQESETQRPH